MRPTSASPSISNGSSTSNNHHHTSSHHHAHHHHDRMSPSMYRQSQKSLPPPPTSTAFTHPHAHAHSHAHPLMIQPPPISNLHANFAPVLPTSSLDALRLHAQHAAAAAGLQPPTPQVPVPLLSNTSYPTSSPSRQQVTGSTSYQQNVIFLKYLFFKKK